VYRLKHKWELWLFVEGILIEMFGFSLCLMVWLNPKIVYHMSIWVLVEVYINVFCCSDLCV